jgi:hypothetical protein
MVVVKKDHVLPALPFNTHIHTHPQKQRHKTLVLTNTKLVVYSNKTATR